VISTLAPTSGGAPGSPFPTVTSVVGVSPRAVDVVLHVSDAEGARSVTTVGTVLPNAEYALVGGKLVQTRRVPFAPVDLTSAAPP
jgi:hypothetical protein